MTEAAWEGILEAGERILWQGQPGLGFDVSGEDLGAVLTGLGLVVFGIWIALYYAEPGMVATGLVLALAGLATPAVKLFMRRFRFYTITSKRAFIGTAAPLVRRQLRHWALDDPEAIQPFGKRGVYFHREWVDEGKGEKYWKRQGFSMLNDQDAVLTILRAAVSQAGEPV